MNPKGPRKRAVSASDKTVIVKKDKDKVVKNKDRVSTESLAREQ